MRLARDHLTILLNRLYDRDDRRFDVRHPAADIGTLLTVELGEYDDCTVRFPYDRTGYGNARQAVLRDHPKPVADDIPEPDTFLKAVVASGVLDLPNIEEVETFLSRYGDPDLMAGHPPVVSGFDTNLIPWRIPRLLGLHDPDTGVGYVNGFALATGIRDELDWDGKCHDTDPFVDAFGPVYEEYWNQPLGTARISRLGLLGYRTIRDIQQADEIQSGRGDESIIDAYDEYNQARQNDVLLFSNDRNFVAMAKSHRVLAQHVQFPADLPDETTATWQEVELLLYMLAIVFGIVELPGVTVYGVWRGKDELDWQHERVDLDPRSPSLDESLAGDISIVETYEELAEQ